MISPTAHQVGINRVTAERWALYSNHRAHVTQLVSGAARAGGGPLCVLGAGNCNDLDLQAAAKAFSEIHLVDLDPYALSRGMARQSAPCAKLTVTAGTDVSGLCRHYDKWRTGAPTDAEIDSFLRETRPTPSVQLSRGSYGAVLSAAILTQLIETVVMMLGASHPRLLEVLLAVRDSHLRLMSDLLAPGGVGILVTDVVSSDTCPALLGATKDDLLPVLDELIAEHNFFAGVNPVAIGLRFAEDSILAPSVIDVALRPSWIWQIGTERSYLVYAITFQKAPPHAAADAIESTGDVRSSLGTARH